MQTITQPTLVLDTKKAEQNIRHFVTKFRDAGVEFRPHFKTHQSAEIAQLFLNFGVQKCTVSSAGMALYFAAHGWNDITIAFPVNVLQMDEYNRLAAQVQLQLIVDSEEQLEALCKHLKTSVTLFIEIDTGYYRSGIFYNDIGKIEALISKMESYEHFTFGGFLSHTGNTYGLTGKAEILSAFNEARLRMLFLKEHFHSRFPNLIISMGDTPAASLADQFDGIDEIRPGNFVFYDVMQFLAGSCTEDKVAVAVYCPVVAVYPKRNQVIIYGGGVHLSKEKLQKGDEPIYGLVSIPTETGFGELLKEAAVISLSQEHGIVRMSADQIQSIKVGDLIAVWPVHSCMTADLNASYLTLNGRVIPKYRTY